MSLGLPPDLTWYKLLMDQGSFIGGVFALAAGAAAYIGARQAAAKQIAALSRRDRLQARGIVVGVYAELRAMQHDHERAFKVIRNEFPAVSGGLTVTIVATVRSAQIEIPPLLARNTDNFFLVEPGGMSLQQVVTYTQHYNGKIDRLWFQIFQDPNIFDAAAHLRALEGTLQIIAMALADALCEIGPIHDEATGAG